MAFWICRHRFGACNLCSGSARSLQWVGQGVRPACSQAATRDTIFAPAFLSRALTFALKCHSSIFSFVRHGAVLGCGGAGSLLEGGGHGWGQRDEGVSGGRGHYPQTKEKDRLALDCHVWAGCVGRVLVVMCAHVMGVSGGDASGMRPVESRRLRAIASPMSVRHRRRPQWLRGT